MTAFNVVRFKVKQGSEERFVDMHRKLQPSFRGLVRGNLIKTGDRTFCMIGEWTSLDRLAAARPQMIGVLDQLRDMLEDLGGGLGVTDPVSGEVVLRLAVRSVTRPAKRQRKTKRLVGKKTRTRAKRR
jgi:hypothetical protein